MARRSPSSKTSSAKKTSTTTSWWPTPRSTSSRCATVASVARSGKTCARRCPTWSSKRRPAPSISSAWSSRPPAWPTRAPSPRPSSWTTRSPSTTCSTPSSPSWTPSLAIRNPTRAPQKRVHFGEVPIKEVFDLKGFNLNAKLDIDPDFLNEGHGHAHKHDHGHGHDHDCGHDHDHGEHCDHPHHHAHDDDVKSFVYKATKPFDAPKLEDFLGSMVQIYGPRMLRYKGVLHVKGIDKKVVFQGVHQLMGSDTGPKWAPNETKQSKMVFIGIDIPQDLFKAGLDQCLA